MVSRNDCVQPFATEFVARTISAENWQRKQRQIDSPLVDKTQKLVGEVLYDVNVHAGKEPREAGET
jgi:hypothetical protein